MARVYVVAVRNTNIVAVKSNSLINTKIFSMTRIQKKLHQFLIDTGKRAEEMPTQSFAEIQELFNVLRSTPASETLKGKQKAVTELTAALSKWAVDNL